MIKKERNISLRVRTLQAAIRRISPDHPRYADIVKELGIKEAGYSGEQALDYYIDILPDTEMQFFVFHDLRLPYKNHFFQIDTLLLFSSFYLILEIKNYKGTLNFDPKYQQLIQEIDDNEAVSYQDPILQVQNQAIKFSSWLKSMNLPEIPGESLVVLTNKNSIIKANSNPRLVEQHVTRSMGLNVKVNSFLKKHSNPLLNKKELRKISSQLLKGNTPIESSPLVQYGISQSDIISGVCCPNCSHLGMVRVFGKWYCPKCHTSSKNAHIRALEDYALLVKPSISNKELRDFLGIKNEYTARRLIQAMNLEQTGETKGREYILPFI